MYAYSMNVKEAYYLPQAYNMYTYTYTEHVVYKICTLNT